MAKELDAHVEEFRTRRLDDAGPFTFVAADALVLKVREGGRVVGFMPWSPPASTTTATGRSSARQDPYITLVSVSIGSGSIDSLHHSVPSWLGPLVRPMGPNGPGGVA